MCLRAQVVVLRSPEFSFHAASFSPFFLAAALQNRKDLHEILYVTVCVQYGVLVFSHDGRVPSGVVKVTLSAGGSCERKGVARA